MSQKVTVTLTDDLDGSEATETVRFSLDGVWYEIDLNPGNAERLRSLMEEWVKCARRTGAAPSRSASETIGRRKREGNPENAAIRDWARDNGHDVNVHGRVPADVRAMYELSQKN